MDSDNTGIGLSPGTILNDYEILEPLGKGGFGITYLAEDTNLNKKVVIKELLPDGIAVRVPGDSQITHNFGQEEDFEWAVNAFLREAQTIANFEHPNIVRVQRLFKDNGTAYIVMPFINGKTLKQIIEEEAPMPQEKVISILVPLLKGLEVVHNSKVLHRDIKPDNIFITDEGAPVLIDFGSARQNVSGKSLDITSIITPGYAAIEQYSTDSKYQGPWSDIYGVAAVVYHMMTAQKPVAASERNDSHRNREPDPLEPLISFSLKNYDNHFLDGITQALEMSEAERPQNIKELNKILFQDPSTQEASHSNKPNQDHQAAPILRKKSNQDLNADPTLRVKFKQESNRDLKAALAPKEQSKKKSNHQDQDQDHKAAPKPREKSKKNFKAPINFKRLAWNIFKIPLVLCLSLGAIGGVLYFAGVIDASIFQSNEVKYGSLIEEMKESREAVNRAVDELSYNKISTAGCIAVLDTQRKRLEKVTAQFNKMGIPDRGIQLRLHKKLGQLNTPNDFGLTPIPYREGSEILANSFMECNKVFSRLIEDYLLSDSDLETM